MMINMKKCDLIIFFSKHKEYCIQKIENFQKKIVITDVYYHHTSVTEVILFNILTKKAVVFLEVCIF